MAPLLTSVSSLSHNGDSDETDVIKAEPLTASSTRWARLNTKRIVSKLKWNFFCKS